MAELVARAPLLVLLVLLAGTAVPTAMAQTEMVHGHGVTANVPPDDRPIVPITEVREAVFTVTVTCDGPLETKSEAHVLTYTATADKEWATVTLDKESDTVEFSATDCAHEVEHIRTVTARVSFGADAPAYQKANVRLLPRIDDRPGGEASTEFVAGFYERWQARFEQSVVRAGPWEHVTIPLTIENHGNGAIKVRFPVNEMTSKALTLAPPGTQIVPSLIQGFQQNRLTIPIDVRTPDDGPRMDQIIIDIEGNSADDETIRLSPLQVSAVVHTDAAGGSASEAPGIAPMVLLLLLALAFCRRSWSR
ncbi:MAG: hypothetical protein KY455_03920 [Euryarchaeota archaeon]|nr:hypothetical protein [Euryarchaeota archaeon]